MDAKSISMGFDCINAESRYRAAASVCDALNEVSSAIMDNYRYDEALKSVFETMAAIRETKSKDRERCLKEWDEARSKYKSYQKKLDEELLAKYGEDFCPF
jgi:flagellar motor switch protein FliG